MAVGILPDFSINHEHRFLPSNLNTSSNKSAAFSLLSHATHSNTFTFSSTYKQQHHRGQIPRSMLFFSQFSTSESVFKKPTDTKKLVPSDSVGFRNNLPNSVKFSKNRLKSI
jgi:hypothetical protein